MTISEGLRRRQLDGIESVIKLREEYPSIEIKSAMNMIEGILSEQDRVEGFEIDNEIEGLKQQARTDQMLQSVHHKGKYSIGEKSKQRKKDIVELYKKGRATTIIAERFGVTETRIYQILKEMGIPRSDGKARESLTHYDGNFDKKYELIGQQSNGRVGAVLKNRDNPWGIKVGTFQKCPVCQKVGIVKLRIDSHPNDPTSFTYLYEVYTHSDKTDHQVNLASVKGPHKYEWFTDNVKQIKRTFRGVEI